MGMQRAIPIFSRSPDTSLTAHFSVNIHIFLDTTIHIPSKKKQIFPLTFCFIYDILKTYYIINMIVLKLKHRNFRSISQGDQTMNTERQNPKTQLPRAIEEKPIVYDDEQLEEVREIATLPSIQLSPDEIEFAISLFARGFGRGDVVTILIEQFPERDAQARADGTFRKRLADKLRICDPTSALFAESRFKTLYHLHQEHVRETLGNTYFRIDSLLKETLSERVEAQIARLEKIDTRIEHLHELYNRYQTAHAEARMPELRDDAFQNLHATDQSLLKWYNLRLKEEQHLAKLFLSLKTLEARLADISSLHAAYTPQEW